MVIHAPIAYALPMSWDVYFQRWPEGVRSMDEVPSGFVPTSPLCSRPELLAKIQAIAPEVDATDPAWAVLNAEGFSIEFNIGDDDPVMSLMLHVRGGGGSLGVIHELAETLRCVAIDGTTGDALDPASPAAERGLQEWRAYLARAVAGDAEA